MSSCALSPLLLCVYRLEDASERVYHVAHYLAHNNSIKAKSECEVNLLLHLLNCARTNRELAISIRQEFESSAGVAHRIPDTELPPLPTANEPLALSLLQTALKQAALVLDEALEQPVGPSMRALLLHSRRVVDTVTDARILYEERLIEPDSQD